MQKQGYGNIPDSAKKILKQLEDNDGFLNLNDKSEPAEIVAQLGMSKKTFKKAIGGLYKRRIVRIDEKGLHLIK